MVRPIPAGPWDDCFTGLDAEWAEGQIYHLRNVRHTNLNFSSSPLLTGIIADALDLQTAILSISITAWLLCFVIYLGALTVVGADIRSLRAELRRRAEGQLSVRQVPS